MLVYAKDHSLPVQNYILQLRRYESNVYGLFKYSESENIRRLYLFLKISLNPSIDLEYPKFLFLKTMYIKDKFRKTNKYKLKIKTF